MPLMRFQLRNEFGLGHPELYRSAHKDDPKAMLDGIAVSGLVGILRQLGDLAQFAADMFHDLHEEVTATATRTRKLMTRVNNIEEALPPVERALAAQRSHLHFAYTAGCDWHPNLKIDQNLLGHSDLPQFIMDSYEECREPPRLFLLDKFDPAGAGACLKRYSDPSYFKRVCACSKMLKSGKGQKEKRARTHKRNGSRYINGDISHSVSLSRRYSSSRFHFSSFDANEHLTAECVPDFEMGSTSRLTDPSNSVVPKSNLNRTEYDSSSNSSVAPKIQNSNVQSCPLFEHENSSVNAKKSLGDIEHICSSVSSVGIQEDARNEVLTPSFRMMYDSEHLSPHNDPNVGDEVQNLHCESLPDQAAVRSSSVSWEEKTELANPAGQNFENILEDQFAATDSLPMHAVASTMEIESTCPKAADENSIVLNVENASDLISAPNHFDEITSETDNYMDALNTMESDTDTDTEFQTKREVDLQLNKSPREFVDQTSQTIGTDQKASVLFDLETCISSQSSSMNETSQKCPHLSHDDSLANLEPPQLACTSFTLNKDSDLMRKSDCPQDSSIRSGLIGSGKPSEHKPPEIEGGEDIIGAFQPSQAFNVSEISSVQIWTNGGLLGLEPSKPLDFSVSSLAKQVSQDSASATSETKAENYDHSCSRSIPATENPPREVDHDNLEESSTISGLTYKFLRNGTWRRTSQSENNSTELYMGKDNDPTELRGKLNSVVETKKSLNGCLHQDFYRAASRENFRFGSPSPPLEHMKISFHPMSGLEMPKLKLEFPTGRKVLESNHDVLFPAFQLHQEPSFPLRDTCFESDDDTFCKSSQYQSDDPLSPHSCSNSEQWESRESNGSAVHDMYGILHRVSSNVSLASASEPDEETGPFVPYASESRCLDGENGFQSLNSGPSLGLHSFRSVSAPMEEHVELAGEWSNLKDPLESRSTCSIEHPRLPPLPPLQWRITKPQITSTIEAVTCSGVANQHEGVEVQVSTPLEEQKLPVPKPTQNEGPRHLYGKQSTFSETANQPVGCVMESNSLKQSKPMILKPPHIESTPLHNLNTLDFQKVNGRMELIHTANGKDVHEREDFLHQIRTKSFSLRPIALTRPSIKAAPSTNVMVSAILEKANAIRQAVGSDEGADDDNWSDD